jgi:hypothetical protein
MRGKVMDPVRPQMTMDVAQAEERKFLSIGRGAAFVSVSEGMIRRLLERRQLTRYKLGARTLIDPQELLTLVQPEK